MWPVQVVQELLRHRSLNTTWLYLYYLGELDHSVIDSVDELADVFAHRRGVDVVVSLGQQLKVVGVSDAAS
jgi:hypothetical protein